MKMSLIQCLHEIGTNYPEMADAVRCVSTYTHLFRAGDAATNGHAFGAILEVPLPISDEKGITAWRVLFFPQRVSVSPILPKRRPSGDSFVWNTTMVYLLERFEEMLRTASDLQRVGVQDTRQMNTSSRRRQKGSKR